MNRDPLTPEDEARLDVAMLSYLGRKSCTPWHSIACHFELHANEEIDASLERLEKHGRIEYEARREGYVTRASPSKGNDK